VPANIANLDSYPGFIIPDEDRFEGVLPALLDQLRHIIAMVHLSCTLHRYAGCVEQERGIA
jgi:hypothetical protein